MQGGALSCETLHTKDNKVCDVGHGSHAIWKWMHLGTERMEASYIQQDCDVLQRAE